jgi:hypothetical protein
MKKRCKTCYWYEWSRQRMPCLYCCQWSEYETKDGTNHLKGEGHESTN